MMSPLLALSPYRKFVLILALFISIGLSASYAKEQAGIRIAFDEAISSSQLEKAENNIQVDIVREALQRQGYKLIPVFVPSANKEMLFKEKAVDGVATANKSLADAKFSKAYVTFHDVAITLKSRHLVISDVSDLKGLKISAFQGATHYLGDSFRALAKNNPLYSEEAQQLNQNRLLYSQAVDVIIADRTIFTYLNQMLRKSIFAESEPAVVMHPIFSPNSYRIGFHDEKLRDQFNLGIASLSKADMEAIYARNQNAIRLVR